MRGKTNGIPKEKPDKATIKRLFSYILKYKLKFIIVLIAIFLSSIISAISGSAVGILVDKYIIPMMGLENPNFAPVISFLSVLMAIYVVGFISAFIYNRLMVDISQGVLRDIRNETFAHMQKLPIKYFDTNSTGDIMSHYTNDIDTLRQLLSQSIPQMFAAIITVSSIFIAMLVMSPPLTLIVVLTLFLNLFVIKNIASRSSKYFVAQQESLADINGYIEEMIHGQKVVKVFSYEERAKEAFDKKNEELRENARKANTFANILMPTMTSLGIFQYVLLAIIGGVLSINGIIKLEVGIIISFLMLIKSFNTPLGQMSQQLNAIITAMAGAKRVFKLIDEEIEQDAGYVSLVNAKYEGENLVETAEKTGIWAWKHPHSDGSVTYSRLNGEVELEEVHFEYKMGIKILKDITVAARSGKKIALVGSTGAGKTTITNLLNRFYDIANGKIRYDGINIEKIKKPDLRRSLGVVLQDSHLFSGTILDNIRYGNLDATDEQCIEAAKKANAHHFIELLKDDYNTEITGEADGISQGQKQLLSIARAIVADPPVMILDEATSSIDTHTEAIVQKGMDTLMKGRTVFVIAHRLSTIQNSDLIVVLEKGEIIESGNHDELIGQKGKYYQLYTGAFELE